MRVSGALVRHVNLAGGAASSLKSRESPLIWGSAVRFGFLCHHAVSGGMDCGCIRLTVYCRDLPGATTYSAEAPITSTQSCVGKLTTAAGASTIAGFDLGNRTSSIEHPYDRS